MYRIVQFYKFYPILSQVASQLSWAHYLELIGLSNENERKFYENLCILKYLGRNELRKQIKERTFFKYKKEGKILSQPATQLTQLPNLFKEMYNFEFLQLPDDFSENALEEGLIKNVENLLLELGNDFSLSGRQRKIIIDGQIHSIDLEFYHRGIPCIIIVELKKGIFKSSYIGQMNKYLNYYSQNKKYDWEKEPIGLIICEDKGKEEVHYSLGNIKNSIFIALYKTKLPNKEFLLKKLNQMKK